MSEEDGEIPHTGEDQDITCGQNNGEPGTPDGNAPSCPKYPEHSKKSVPPTDEDTLETPRPGSSQIKGAKIGDQKIRSMATDKAEQTGITSQEVASALPSFMALPPEKCQSLLKLPSKEEGHSRSGQ